METADIQVFKKSKKRSRKQENVEEAAPAPVEETVEEPVAEVVESKKDKKKKKQKKEQQQEEQVEAAPETAVESEAVESKKDKKKKKSKKNKEEAAPVEAEVEAQPATTSKSEFNHYKENATLAKVTAEDVNTYRESNHITVSFFDNSNPKEPIESEPQVYSDDGATGEFKDLKPICNFNEVTLPGRLSELFATFNKPTPIQSQCWPFLLSGKDLIGLAETGSGKTLAFGVPGFVHLMSIKPKVKGKKGPFALVMSPTRELAIQTFEVCEAAGKLCNLNSACFYGGVAKDSQYKSLQTGVDIVVATPGRLLDLINEGALKLENVSYVVLDEADRMLDKGFEFDIKKILGMTPSTRQTIMFSATWPTSIRRLASTFLKNPIKVTIGKAELAANTKITQIVEVIEGDREKDKKLLQLIESYHKSRKNRILIFVLYKKEAPRVEDLLKKRGWKVAGIHGDISQQQRIAALNSFKDGTCPLLVATDVAARGLDIPDVEYVINYSFPLTIEDYVHRIGRTGRAGKTGTSYTMFTANDKLRAAELCAILQEAGSEVPEALRKLGSYGTKKQEHAMYGHHVKDLNKPMGQKSHIKFD